MRSKLETIIKLTTDDSYSHQARMISIRKEAEAALAELDKTDKGSKPADGPKTGNDIQKPHPPTTGPAAK